MLEGSEYISYREFTKLVYVAVAVDDAFRTVWIASRPQNSAVCLILMRVKLLPYTVPRSGNTRMLMTSQPFLSPQCTGCPRFADLFSIFFYLHKKA